MTLSLISLDIFNCVLFRVSVNASNGWRPFHFVCIFIYQTLSCVLSSKCFVFDQHNKIMTLLVWMCLSPYGFTFHCPLAHKSSVSCSLHSHHPHSHIGTEMWFLVVVW